MMNSTAQHTPAPWKVIVLDKEIYINPQRETGEYGLMLKMLTGHSAKQANAAHIVRCVNEREELLRALRYVYTMLDDNKGKSQGILYSDALGPNDDDMTVRDYLKALISRAQEAQS